MSDSFPLPPSHCRSSTLVAMAMPAGPALWPVHSFSEAFDIAMDTTCPSRDRMRCLMTFFASATETKERCHTLAVQMTNKVNELKSQHKKPTEKNPPKTHLADLEARQIVAGKLAEMLNQGRLRGVQSFDCADIGRKLALEVVVAEN